MNEIRRYFDTAQICENGHVITIHYNSLPVERKNYCPSCNAKTIFNCPNCNTDIQGCYHTYTEHLDSYNMFSPGEEKYHYETNCLINFENYVAPAFCPTCGEPYPWTCKFLDAADKMVDYLDELSDSQKQILKSTFPNLIVETPDSILSAMQATKLLDSISSVGKGFLEALLKEHVIESLILLMKLK